MSCYAFDFIRTDPENKQICLQITRQNIDLKGAMMKFQPEIPPHPFTFDAISE